jgi:hypothetical protein
LKVLLRPGPFEEFLEYLTTSGIRRLKSEGELEWPRRPEEIEAVELEEF